MWMVVFLDRFPQSFLRVAVFSPIFTLQYDGYTKRWHGAASTMPLLFYKKKNWQDQCIVLAALYFFIDDGTAATKCNSLNVQLCFP
jgi:hypothetical protein